MAIRFERVTTDGVTRLVAVVDDRPNHMDEFGGHDDSGKDYDKWGAGFGEEDDE